MNRSRTRPQRPSPARVPAALRPRALARVLVALAIVVSQSAPARACFGTAGSLDCSLGLAVAQVVDRPTPNRDGWSAGGVLDASGSADLLERIASGGVSVAFGAGALGGSFVPTDEIAFAASECAFGDAAHKRLRCANGSGKLTFSPTRAALYHRVGVSGRGREFALPTVASLPLAVVLTANDAVARGDTAFPCASNAAATKISCRNTDPDTTTTAGILCDLSRSVFNASPSVNATSTSAWTCDGNSRVLTGNGLPDHAVGAFPNPHNPNTISVQGVSASYTLEPAVVAGPATSLGVPGIGHALNGVKFDPGTAEACTDAGECDPGFSTAPWRIEALGQNSFDFGTDENNAHVQPGGAYHYHGMPEGLLDALGKGAAMSLVGWARDGFPIYARYGFSDPRDPASTIRAVTGSYRLKATPDAGRPATIVYAMGAFTQDWEYVAGSGDLDECNGRFGVTPEFPLGIYHYFITDSYPFIQRCVKGTPTGPVGGGGGGGPPPPPPQG